MKLIYKGFEIEVEREKCLAGYSMLYFTVMELDTLWFLVDSFEDSSETIREKIKQMKEIVDDYLKNPKDYLEEEDIDEESVCSK